MPSSASTSQSPLSVKSNAALISALDSSAQRPEQTIREIRQPTSTFTNPVRSKHLISIKTYVKPYLLLPPLLDTTNSPHPRQPSNRNRTASPNSRFLLKKYHPSPSRPSVAPKNTTPSPPKPIIVSHRSTSVVPKTSLPYDYSATSTVQKQLSRPPKKSCWRSHPARAAIQRPKGAMLNPSPPASPIPVPLLL